MNEIKKETPEAQNKKNAAIFAGICGILFFIIIKDLYTIIFETKTLITGAIIAGNIFIAALCIIMVQPLLDRKSTALYLFFLDRSMQRHIFTVSALYLVARLTIDVFMGLHILEIALNISPAFACWMLAIFFEELHKKHTC